MTRELREIPIELIDEPLFQSRVVMDPVQLEELAESVKLKGVLEPLLVIELPATSDAGPGDGEPQPGRLNSTSPPHYRVMAGHRRLLSGRMAHLKTLPCMVHAADYQDEDMVMLEDNMHREDVTAAGH